MNNSARTPSLASASTNLPAELAATAPGLSSPAPSRSRIAPVDGLRAIAVLGVIWAHVWSFYGSLAWPLLKIHSHALDVNRAVSVIGTGVNLFFVISGFCMYLMYARKQTHFSWSAYGIFIKNRWLRIAPAFYAAVLCYAILHPLNGTPFPLFDLLSHTTFTAIWFTNPGNIAAPLWSIATEWHFYLLLPLFIWASSRLGFWPVVGLSIVFSAAFRAWYYLYAIPTFTNPMLLANLEYQVPFHLMEFVWGICVARFYTAQVQPPAFLLGAKGFVLAYAIAYCGRMMLVTEIVQHAHALGPFLEIMGHPVLALGYALALWNVISSPSLFQRILSSPASQAIGRYSYSMYLWHWGPCVWFSFFIVKRFGTNPLAQNFTFLLVLLVLIPFSYLSYSLLEAPYFRRRQAPAVVAPPVATSI